MSLIYCLYETQTKEYICLGKKSNNRFQMKADLIIKFIVRHLTNGQFEIYHDGGYSPEEDDDSWQLVADIWDTDLSV